MQHAMKSASVLFDDFVLDGEQLAGNSFAFAPEWSGSVGGVYTFGNGAWFAMEATFTGSSYSNVENTQRIGSRSSVNAQVGYAQNNWSVLFFVDNIFDQERFTSINRDTNTATVTDPRVIGVNLTASF